ncbi:serine/threonine-protein kinase [Actinoplanes sp. NPDC024001]|uniref:serine/threonine-protein kinase n=1 Tax=Actinoplanes sp. NPDC024001 TaxID=3154598 RepID=UPI0033F7C71A
MDSARSHTGLLLGGRYRLLSPIGAGGMAVVWQAHDHVLARTVAVKMVTPQQSDDARARDRIRSEARAAAALAHPNIAQVHDYGEMESDGQIFPYVVMEMVPGGTLLQRMAAGPVSPQFAMRVCAEIAAALAAAHAEGLVHRDIKPANVMLAPTGAKVVDFGIAAAVAADPGPEVLGTPAYLAPERLAGDAVVAASDVYALGVVLYLLLTGRSPWTAENTRQMLDAHIYIEPAPLPAVAGVPDYVVGLCNRCLAKNPAARPSAQEAAAVLAHGAGLRVVTDEPAPVGAAAAAEPTVLVRTVRLDPPASPPTRSKALVIGAAAVVTALLAGGGGWLLMADRPDPDREDVAVAEASAQPPAPPPAPTLVARRSDRPEPKRSRTVSPDAAASPSVAGSRPASPSVATASATIPPTAEPTAAPTAPTAPDPDPEPVPVQRTFTSTGGTIEATCPAPTTAQILSWTPAGQYKVQSTSPGPSAAPAVTFKRGKTLITMTVTCAGSEPTMTREPVSAG